MRIGELAARTGEHVRTLRFWTDHGLLRARRMDNAYRVYGPDAQERIAFIRAAQTLGLTLDAIARLLNLSGAGGQPCAEVLAELGARRETVRRQIAALTAAEQALSAVLREAWEAPCNESGCRFLPRPAGGT